MSGSSSALRGSRAAPTRTAGGAHRLAGLRRYLSLAGGRFFLTWSGSAVLLPACFALLALESRSGFSRSELPLVGLLSMAGTFLACLICHLVTRRRRVRHPLTPVGLLTCCAAAGLVQGVVRAALVAEWTTSPPLLLLRVAGSVLATLVWLPAVAVLQALIAERREGMRQLAAVEERLRLARQDAVASLGQQGDALLHATKEVVEPHLQQLLCQLSELQHDASPEVLGGLADQIRTVSIDVVRAVSHEVAAASTAAAAPAPRPTVRLEVGRQVLTRPIRAPWIVLLMLLASSGMEVVRVEGVGATLIAAAFGALLACVLAGVRALTARASPPMAGALQWTALLLVFLAVLQAAEVHDLLSPDPATVADVLAFTPLYLTGLVLTSIAIAMRRRTVAQLGRMRQRNAELAASARHVQHEAELLARRVSGLLHGPVQGHLTAAAMLLGLHLHGETERSPQQVVDEVRRLVTTAERELAALSARAPEPPSTTDLMRRLQQQWDGIVQVEYAVDDLGPLSAPLQALIGDVLTDMLSNASRHGRARAVQFEVRADADGRAVRLQCCNAGSALREGLQHGMIHRAVLACGGTWELQPMTGGVCSVAVLPLT